MIRLVLPTMRAQGSGVIVNISSITGRLPSFPCYGFYAAGKHALGAMSESLAAEVAPFGIRVLCVEPGYYLTALTDTVDALDAQLDPSSPYADVSHFMLDFTKDALVNGGDPADVADAVVAAVADRRRAPCTCTSARTLRRISTSGARRARSRRSPRPPPRFSPKAADQPLAAANIASSSRRMSGPHGWKTTSVTPLLAEVVDAGLDLVGGAGDRRRRQQRPAGRRPRGAVGLVEVDAVADVDVEVAFVLAPLVDDGQPLLAAGEVGHGVTAVQLVGGVVGEGAHRARRRRAPAPTTASSPGSSTVPQ